MLRPDPSLAPLPAPPASASSRTDWKRGLAMTVGFLAVGAGIGFVLGETDALAFLDALPPLGLAATLLLGLPLVLAVHEAGHVAGGLAVGFRFGLFIAGPLRLEREGDRIVAKWNRSLALAGGIALCLPTDTEDLTRRTAWFVAGGPLASLALGFAGLGVGLGVGGAVGAATEFVGVVSFVIALVTLIPGRTGGFATDGARLLTLLRGGPEAEREAAVLALIAESTAGTRPRDWNPDTLQAAVALRDGRLFEESACQFLTLHALDSGQPSVAREALVRRVELRDTVPATARAGLPADAALFEGAIRRDADRARAWTAAIPRKAALADPVALALADWAVALASEDADGAHAALSALRAAPHSPDGITAARLEWAGLSPEDDHDLPEAD